MGSLSSLLCAGGGAGAGTGAGQGAGEGAAAGSELLRDFFSFRILKIRCWRSTCVLLLVAGLRGSPSSILTCCSFLSCKKGKRFNAIVVIQYSGYALLLSDFNLKMQFYLF